ncbi:MAG: hypothetical protein LBK00_02425 [Treponema sp.]|jgi:hypothetical protein|nr:hypothetical protein [Treponema sp.]
MHPIGIDIEVSASATVEKWPNRGAKIVIVIIMLLFFCVTSPYTLFAQENSAYSWGFAGGFEYNGYSILEPSSGFIVEWRIFENSIAIFGLKTLFSTDFLHVIVGELGWTFQFILFNTNRLSFLLRFDEAFSYTSLINSDRSLVAWSLNTGLAVRVFFTETVFIEPRIQGGYPNIFSAGIIVGFRKKYR